MLLAQRVTLSAEPPAGDERALKEGLFSERPFAWPRPRARPRGVSFRDQTGPGAPEAIQSLIVWISVSVSG
jgi:hypothetical protein